MNITGISQCRRLTDSVYFCFVCFVCFVRQAGLGAMAPAVFRVSSNGIKTMDWPIQFASPGSSTALRPPTGLPTGFEGVIVPESVVAIARFGDAIVEPVVRRVDTELRSAVARDGLVATNDNSLMFAQYDAVFSMGQRRSEVHVLLDQHPW
jgi:SOUL heme-binding protein